jgi:undecaprenyl-diphosphatase
MKPDTLDNNAGLGDYLKQTWANTRLIACEAWILARLRGKLIVLAWLLVLVGAWLIKPIEMDILKSVRGDQLPWVYLAARKISFWGDYYTGSLILVFILLLAGFIVRNKLLRNTAIACLIAATFSGIFTDIFRFGLGRARPNSGVEDGFYGFSRSSKFHGFPSGHTTTAFATVLPIAVSFPALTIPCLAVAGTVGWSRMYTNYHRPTDVLVGAGVGIAFGWTVGLVARRKSEESDST